MTKWRVEACRCDECVRPDGIAPFWEVLGPQAGQFEEFGSWPEAFAYAKAAADNEARKARIEAVQQDAAERLRWQAAWDDYVAEEDAAEALPVDGAVWVGSRDFQWPQVKRYGG